MKKKRFNKKLALNRWTVANLGQDDMKQINGGWDDPIPPETEISCGGGCGQTLDTICWTCPNTMRTFCC